MYQEHWDLKRLPFADQLDPNCFYRGPIQVEALARLHFLVDQHRRLGLLFGGRGVGKSLLLKVLARETGRAGKQVASVNLMGADTRDILWQIAADLGTNPPVDESVFRLWRRVSDHFVENRLLERDTVILLDDADEAHPTALLQIVRLAQCDQNTDTRVTLIVAANTDRFDRLGERLMDLAELRTDLETWDEAHTTGYLQWALSQAGRQESIFDSSSSRLHELAGGIPRRIKQLAELSLLAAAGAQQDRVDLATVESVHQELNPDIVAMRSP